MSLQKLQIFKPDTLVRWHRQGFKRYWRWKSHRCPAGRPKISPEVLQLIKTMSQDNMDWGAPRIHGELEMLGIDISQATIAKYMFKHRKPASQTWRSLLRNHRKDIVSIDFFTVPTVTFQILYGFLVLNLERREVVHFNVTDAATEQPCYHRLAKMPLPVSDCNHLFTLPQESSVAIRTILSFYLLH